MKRHKPILLDYGVIAVMPNWSGCSAETIFRQRAPLSNEPFHAFLHVPAGRLHDGVLLFDSWFGMCPCIVFSVRREDVVLVEGVAMNTDSILYAHADAEWSADAKPDHSETDSLSAFWEKVARWTDGPRVSLGFEAEGFTCLPY